MLQQGPTLVGVILQQGPTLDQAIRALISHLLMIQGHKRLGLAIEALQLILDLLAQLYSHPMIQRRLERSVWWIRWSNIRIRSWKMFSIDLSPDCKNNLILNRQRVI